MFFRTNEGGVEDGNLVLTDCKLYFSKCKIGYLASTIIWEGNEKNG